MFSSISSHDYPCPSLSELTEWGERNRPLYYTPWRIQTTITPPGFLFWSGLHMALQHAALGRTSERVNVEISVEIQARQRQPAARLRCRCRVLCFLSSNTVPGTCDVAFSLPTPASGTAGGVRMPTLSAACVPSRPCLLISTSRRFTVVRPTAEIFFWAGHDLLMVPNSSWSSNNIGFVLAVHVPDYSRCASGVRALGDIDSANQDCCQSGV